MKLNLSPNLAQLAQTTVPSGLENSANEGVLARLKRMKPWLVFPSLAVAAVLFYTVVTGESIIASTFGEWDCACGDWYVNTTRLVLWNPFRNKDPEVAAEGFLQGLRDNECKVSIELCKSALPNHRVPNWKLGYREDDHDDTTLYFKLTKHGGGPGYELTGQGAITVQRQGNKWAVVGYSSYF